jgi:hypothetical protein
MPKILKRPRSHADAMCLHFPDQFDYYWDNLEKACKATTDCAPCAYDLPFASITLNVGRRSCSELHVDANNLAGGLCLVSPYSNFDWKHGGHLVLHQLKVALALPPGSLAFFPSALISHENVPIALHEERRVFTAYSPARLFQWVENGFQPVPHPPDNVKRKRGEEDWKRQVRRFPFGHTF